MRVRVLFFIKKGNIQSKKGQITKTSRGEKEKNVQKMGRFLTFFKRGAPFAHRMQRVSAPL